MEIRRDWLTQQLIETGRIEQNSTLDVTAVLMEPGSKWIRIEALATRSHSRKPYMYWNICIDLDSQVIHWDTTTCYKI